MITLILSIILVNFIILLLLRFVASNREKIVLLSQVSFFSLINIYIFFTQREKFNAIELLTISLFTFWFSIIVLEAWAITNDGYTTLILILIYEHKLSKLNMKEVDIIIQKQKNIARIESLKQLRLVNQNFTHPTKRGIWVIRILTQLKLALLIKNL